MSGNDANANPQAGAKPGFRVDINAEGVKVEIHQQGQQPKVHQVKADDVNRVVNETASTLRSGFDWMSKRFDEWHAKEDAKRQAQANANPRHNHNHNHHHRPKNRDTSPMHHSGAADHDHSRRQPDPRQFAARVGAGQRPPQEEDAFTGGDLALLIVGLLLAAIWIPIAILANLGVLARFVGNVLIATITSLVALVLSLVQLHRPRALLNTWRGVGADWARAGHTGMDLVEGLARMWGLARLVRRIRWRIGSISSRYGEYRTRQSDVTHTPEDFRDKYHVVDQLPSGGSSARIYVVRRAGGDPNELLVLKHFDVHSGSYLENVFREGKAVELAKRLNLIVDSQIDERSFYYVMPYYRGDTFTRRVLDQHDEGNDKRLARAAYEQRSLGWVHQLLQLIAQYHDAGVFHKDIKPDNLIVNNEYLYLVDIGLLTEMRSDQQLTTHGTEYFRDPEMVKLAMQNTLVRDVNVAKFDIYSIGAVIFFAFEGEFPVNGSLSRFRREVPRAVQMVVQKAMANFDKRYANARQMLADVDSLCFAASQNRLFEVRPSELPSFRASVDAADLEAASQAPDHDPMAFFPSPHYPAHAAYHVPAYRQGRRWFTSKGNAVGVADLGTGRGRKGVAAIVGTIVTVGLAMVALMAILLTAFAFVIPATSEPDMEAVAYSEGKVLGYPESGVVSVHSNDSSVSLSDKERIFLNRLTQIASGSIKMMLDNQDLSALDRTSALTEVAQDLEREYWGSLHGVVAGTKFPVQIIEEEGAQELARNLRNVLTLREHEVIETDLPFRLSLEELAQLPDPKASWQRMVSNYRNYLLAERIEERVGARLPVFLVVRASGRIEPIFPGLDMHWQLP